jgi:hypothetical protein
MAARSAAGIIRRPSSTAIQRIMSVPIPERSAAFWIQVWVSLDA